MKIYTKTGDGGDTGLFAGPRVPKDHARIESYGDVDELNAILGVVRSAGLPIDLEAVVDRIQHELFAVGAELATPDPAAHGMQYLGESHIAALERDIDAMESELPPLQQFILPGGTPAAAAMHQARTVCRRAERRVVTLVRQEGEPVSSNILRYLNRLGDLLFVMARVANRRAAIADLPWRKPDRQHLA